MINPIVKSIAENIKKLISLKANIKKAIELKNVMVNESTTFEQYADKIAEIEEGDIFSENYKTYKLLLHNTYTDASSLFLQKDALTNLDLSDWDTKNITNMNAMFHGCDNLTSIEGLNNFNTSNVTNMNHMFYYCLSLTSIDVSSFDTSKVTDMAYMFGHCESLTTLDLSNFDTSNVTTMNHMFSECNNLTSLDLSNFDTSNVTNMYDMFANCHNLTSLDLSNFDTSKVIDMAYMFSCSNLQTIRLDNCSRETIKNIISVISQNYPAGVTRKIYCKRANAEGLTAPNNWAFEYID